MSFINESIERLAPTHMPAPSDPARGGRAPPVPPVADGVHQLVDDRRTRALRDGVPSAQDPRRPRVVALERRGGGERDQRVHERELVVELPDAA